MDRVLIEGLVPLPPGHRDPAWYAHCHGNPPGGHRPIQQRDFIEGWTEEQRKRGWNVPSGDLVHLRLRRSTKADVVEALLP